MRTPRAVHDPDATRAAAPAWRAAGALLAAALLLAQAGFYAGSQSAALRESRHQRAGVLPDGSPASLDFLPLAVFESLGVLAPAIPPDAPVLLVTGTVMPIAYDFQLLPRPLEVLVRVDESLVARVARSAPDVAAWLQEWHAELDQRGQRLGPATLRAHLGTASFLVTVALSVEELPWPPDGPRHERVAQHGPAVLYRIIPAP